MKIYNKYRHIDSFKKLSDAKMQLSYETRLSKHKMDLALFEVQSQLTPARIFSTIFATSIKPLSRGIVAWFKNFLSGNSRNKS